MMHEAPGFVTTRASPLLPPEQAEIAACPGKKPSRLTPPDANPCLDLNDAPGR